MVSPFEDAAALASDAVDAVYGETFRIIPMKEGRYGADIADTDRATREIVGGFIEAAAETPILDNAKTGRAFDHKLLTPTRCVNFELSRLGSDLPRKPDRIVRIEKPGSPVFAVSTVQPFGFSRVVCNLVESSLS